MIKAQSKETTMQATGIFDVTLIPQNDEIAPVGRMVIHKEYQGDLEDDELTRLLKYLISLEDEPNLRKIEKRRWRTTLGSVDSLTKR